MKSHSRGRTVRYAMVAGALFAGFLVTVARAEDPSGVYGLDTGKLTLKVQSPSLLKGVVSLPNLNTLNQRTGLKGQMTFMPTPGQAENFELGLPPLPLIGSLSMPGMWTVPSGSSKFTVEMITDADVQQTVVLLNELLGRTDITASITKRSFIGKVLSGNQVKATFALRLVVTLPPVSLTITMAGNLGGAYIGPVPTAQLPAAPLTTDVRDFLKGFVVDEVKELAARQ